MAELAARAVALLGFTIKLDVTVCASLTGLRLREVIACKLVTAGMQPLSEFTFLVTLNMV